MRSRYVSGSSSARLQAVPTGEPSEHRFAAHAQARCRKLIGQCLHRHPERAREPQQNREARDYAATLDLRHPAVGHKAACPELILREARRGAQRLDVIPKRTQDIVQFCSIRAAQHLLHERTRRRHLSDPLHRHPRDHVRRTAPCDETSRSL